jgi:hypothetical protein
MNHGVSPAQKDLPQILTVWPSWPGAGREGTAKVGWVVALGGALAAVAVVLGVPVPAGAGTGLGVGRVTDC